MANSWLSPFATRHSLFASVPADQTHRKEIAVPKKSEAKLTGEEYQARYDAAAKVARRQYCDIFKFWRGCHYEPCRRAKTCRGDPSQCLQRGRWSLPPDVLYQAELQVRAAVPAHLTGPERMVSATSWLSDRVVTKRK
jgi:hypothetical protein